MKKENTMNSFRNWQCGIVSSGVMNGLPRLVRPPTPCAPLGDSTFSGDACSTCFSETWGGGTTETQTGCRHNSSFFWTNREITALSYINKEDALVFMMSIAIHNWIAIDWTYVVLLIYLIVIFVNMPLIICAFALRLQKC